MNSHRDNMKDAIMTCLEKDLDFTRQEITATEMVYSLADAVFDAIGVTEDEQDKIGGYFMLHAGKREEPKRCTGCNVQLNSADKVWEGRCVACHTKDLREGMKYSREDFQYYASKAVKMREGNAQSWVVLLETPIGCYGDVFWNATWKDAVDAFVLKNYRQYEDDFETVRIKGLERELNKEEAELAKD